MREGKCYVTLCCIVLYYVKIGVLETGVLGRVEST